MDLKNKTAVVTGATGGIGRELVRRLDEEGARLILVSKTESELQNLVKNLKNTESTYFVCDFSDQDSIEKVAKEISSKFDKVDLLINSAGIGIYKSIEDVELTDWNKSFNINVTSNLVFTKYLNKNLQNSETHLFLLLVLALGLSQWQVEVHIAWQSLHFEVWS